MEKEKLVGVNDFAKIVGVSPRAVVQALNKGRISFEKVGARRMINPLAGKVQWAATIDKVASERGKASGRKKTAAIKAKKAGKKAGKKKAGKKNPSGVPKQPRYIAPPKFDEHGDMTVAEAERQEKVNKAKLSDLKYLEQSGKLIDADKVERKAFEMGRKVRDAVMGIPARFCHELAVETNPHKLEIQLTKILQKALEKLIIGEQKK